MNDNQPWNFTRKIFSGHNVIVTKEKIEKEKDEVKREGFGRFTEDDSKAKEFEMIDPESDEFFMNCGL
jgi:hypothetical protein